MTQTRKTPLRVYGYALSAALLVAALPAAADDYDDARADLLAAYEAVDYTAMRAAAERALAARPGYPGAMFNLAFAQVLDGDPDASLATLNRLAAQKIDFGIADIEGFAPLKELSGWDDYFERVAAIKEPIGNARVVWTYPTSKFIPEGIAVSAEKELYLGSIRHGDIVRIGVNERRVASARGVGHWSVFGMRLKGDALWYVSSAIAEFEGLSAQDAGSNGLYAVDTRDGRLLRSAPLPKTDGEQVLGDLVIADADTIFLTDQADGVVYRYSIRENSFQTLLARGTIVSPQGLVLDARREHLYVADYVGGIYRVALASGAVEGVSAEANTSLYGIDGLYRYRDELIAIQNGIRPHRVVALTLSDDGRSVVGSRILAMNLAQFDEPNLGQVVGDAFVFIANSHWNRFDAQGELPVGLSGPVVLEVELDD